MKLKEYLLSHTLITNTYNIFDYERLITRLKIRYGNQYLRRDVEVEEIADIAQNVIDVNADYFKNLFSGVINPFETWGEKESRNDKVIDETTNTVQTTNTTEHTGTITNADEGTIQREGNGQTRGKSSQPTENTSTTSVNAYNSSTASPRDTTTSKGTTSTEYEDNNTNNSTETRNITNTQTNNNTDKTTMENSGKINKTRNSDGMYNRNGYNINDYITAVRVYNNAYDIIINYIVNDILTTIPNLERWCNNET